MDELLQLIKSGIYSSDNLPPSLYLDIQSEFTRAIFKGWGKELSSYSIIDPEYQLLDGFSKNMQRFSGAKTWQQVKNIESIVGIESFIQEGRNIFELYNKTWMSTEIDAVIKLADEARNFLQYEKEKEIFPLLKFQTVGDSRVRPHHRSLDGITKPVNDPFWNTYSPPLDWNCFVKGTNVLTPDGYKEIQTLKQNDLVIGGGGKPQRVNHVMITPINDEVVCIFTKKSSCSATKNHRILTNKGWVIANNINRFDILFNISKSGIINNIVTYVNNMNVLIANIVMPRIINRYSTATKTLNTNIKVWKEYINKVRANRVVENIFNSNPIKPINTQLFTSSRWCFAVDMSTWVESVSFFNFKNTLGSMFRPIKRAGYFKFFSYLSKIRSIFFSFTKSGMRQAFNILLKSISLLFFPFFVIYPLAFNRFRAVSNWYIKKHKSPHDSSIIKTPPFNEFSNSKELINVKIKNSFGSGAPLDGFNSLNSFICYSFFHYKFDYVTNTNVQKYNDNVYNLEVNNDETYITGIGVVHNCRCLLIQLEDGKITPDGEIDFKEVKKETSDVFNNNPNRSGKLFKETGKYKHPYFKGATKEQIENNFGMGVL